MQGKQKEARDIMRLFLCSSNDSRFQATSSLQPSISVFHSPTIGEKYMIGRFQLNCFCVMVNGCLIVLLAKGLVAESKQKKWESTMNEQTNNDALVRGN
jgi:hypothetical protein